MAMISDDGGMNFRASTTPITGYYSVQPSIVRKRSDGSLKAYMRDNGSVKQVYEASSFDGGDTWSVALQNPQIKESGSGLEVIELRDGTWIMIVNDIVSGRWQLSLYSSLDEGGDWTKVATVEYDGSQSSTFSYPSIQEDRFNDRLILATYSHFTSAGKSIKFKTVQL